MRKSSGLTLIELLIVVFLLTILAVAGGFSWVASLRNSRDARRMVDLENIRAAIEMYRTNNGVYPNAPLPFGTGALTDGSHTYSGTLPQDPLYPKQVYYYFTSSGSDYTLAAQLENLSSCQATSQPPAGSCGPTYNCNYCIGPYGKK